MSWLDRQDMKPGLLDRGMQSVSKSVSAVPRGLLEGIIVLMAAVALIFLFVEKSPYYAVGAVVVLFAVLLLMRQPVRLTYVLVFIIPLYWINLLGRSMRVITVLTMIAVAYHLSRVVLERKTPRYNHVYLAYGLYLLTCFFSLFNSVDVTRSYLGMKYFLLSLGILFVMTVSIKTKEQLRLVIIIIIGWGIAQSILGMLQTFVSVKFFPAYYFHTFGMPIIDAYAVGGVRRASGTFQVGPRYAMFIMMPLAFVFAGFLSGKLLSRRTWLLLITPFVVGLVVSLTRIAVALGLIYVALYNFFERRRQALVASVAGLVVLGVVVTAVVAFAIPGDVKYALMKRFTDSDDEVYMDRLYFLWNALGAWTENPFLGIGVSTYEMRSWEFMQKYPVPWRQYQWDVAQRGTMPETVPVHNEYGRMLAEQGILAIPTFIFLLLAAFWNLRFAQQRSRDPFIKWVALGTSIYLVAMMIYWYFHEYFMEEPYVSILPFTLSIILVDIVKKEEAEPSGETAT